MVQNIDAMRAGLRRYVGRHLDTTIAPGQLAYVPNDEVCELPSYHEYVRAIQDGDLWAADEDTAAFCRVKFDFAFGANETE